MLNPIYHIPKPEGSTGGNAGCTLILQLDTNALFYLIMRNEVLVELKYFRLETSDPDNYLLELETVLEESVGDVSGFKDIVLIYNWPDSSLVPNEYYAVGTNSEILAMIHGDLKQGIVFAETVKEWEMHNIYRVPQEIHELMQHRVPGARVLHFNTPWLESVNKTVEGIRLVVLPGQMLVLLTANGKLLISQRFAYETDDDIYFYLLSLGKEFAFDPAITPLEVSGFILEESSLLDIIRKFFPLMTLSTTTRSTGQYPSHFFSPILNLAKCVL